MPPSGLSRKEADQAAMEGRKLFLKGVPLATTEKEIADAFAAVAPVIEVVIPRFKDSGKSRGFAFAIFRTVEEAQEATTVRMEIRGSVLQIEFATPREYLGQEHVRERQQRPDMVYARQRARQHDGRPHRHPHDHRGRGRSRSRNSPPYSPSPSSASSRARIGSTPPRARAYQRSPERFDHRETRSRQYNGQQQQQQPYQRPVRSDRGDTIVGRRGRSRSRERDARMDRYDGGRRHDGGAYRGYDQGMPRGNAERDVRGRVGALGRRRGDDSHGVGGGGRYYGVGGGGGSHGRGRERSPMRQRRDPVRSPPPPLDRYRHDAPAPPHPHAFSPQHPPQQSRPPPPPPPQPQHYPHESHPPPQQHVSPYAFAPSHPHPHAHAHGHGEQQQYQQQAPPSPSSSSPYAARPREHAPPPADRYATAQAQTGHEGYGGYGGYSRYGQQPRAQRHAPPHPYHQRQAGEVAYAREPPLQGKYTSYPGPPPSSHPATAPPPEAYHDHQYEQQHRPPPQPLPSSSSSSLSATAPGHAPLAVDSVLYPGILASAGSGSGGGRGSGGARVSTAVPYPYHQAPPPSSSSAVSSSSSLVDPRLAAFK
ncbi:hypothetical protein PTSG_10364 [Salpingoeca rosetta]|uniref:RRM domain-containing protein n=1 Tax=Salpingoeca rosetta (strain ATCC 50818 / BSB-021) TaxID=946362 RepID=F2UR34_SALR5|nr:uncharacterized protein PTSG_10364 [Salpingoeca rosetta]EGD80089.1 hypothetical protein PTSG_10364 [Salpingoeca rosetta]|eukprot:XP_004988414.1 hypothetical protein PTSG_10364 [Salpingoeca rosetta]